MDSDAEKEFHENLRLGTDLLDAATKLTDDPEQMERYDKILNMALRNKLQNLTRIIFLVSAR